MGIELRPEENDPVPRRVYLRLVCDGEVHDSLQFMGMANLPNLPHEFNGDGNGYVAQRKAATDSGWRFAGNGKVYGPCCSNRKDSR